MTSAEATFFSFWRVSQGEVRFFTRGEVEEEELSRIEESRGLPTPKIITRITMKEISEPKVFFACFRCPEVVPVKTEPRPGEGLGFGRAVLPEEPPVPGAAPRPDGFGLGREGRWGRACCFSVLRRCRGEVSVLRTTSGPVEREGSLR